jgi:hypothetical protein
LTGQLDHISHQQGFIGTTDRHLTLRGSVLPQDATSAALRDTKLAANTINASTATSGMRPLSAIGPRTMDE